MTLKHIKFSESSVMRSLERYAIKKGIAKPEDVSEIVKTASEESFEPSNNLFDDVLRLSSGLRERGFEKQADDLENAAWNFKTAETHLYKAHDEDGEDLLDFAHPEGSPSVSDAKEGHGKVDNLVDQHKKIVDIVNKAPTGKYASVLDDVAETLGLKKKADFNQLEEKIININYFKNELLKELTKENAYYFTQEGYLFIGRASIRLGNVIINPDGSDPIIPKSSEKFNTKFLNYFQKNSSITSEIWKQFQGGHLRFEDLVTPEKISSANAALAKRYSDVVNKIKSLPNIPNPKDGNANKTLDATQKTVDGINGLFDEYSWFDFKGLTVNDGPKENKIRMELIPGILKNAEELISLLGPSTPEVVQETAGPDEVLTSWWAGNLAGKFDRLSAVAAQVRHQAANEFKQMANVIRAGINKPFRATYSALIQLDQSNSEYTDKNKLDAVAIEWENYFKTNKEASTNNLITKNAIGKPPAKEQAVSMPPPGYSEQEKKPGAGFTGRSTKTTHKAPTPAPKEYNAVLAMQYSLHALANALTNSDTRKKIMDVAKLSDDEAVDLSIALAGTGKGDKRHEDAPDGTWGPNTESALLAAQDLFNRLNKVNPEFVKGKLVSDAQYNKGVPENQIVERANSNRTILNSVLEGVGASHLIPENTEQQEYDKLPRTDMTSEGLMSNVNEIGETPLHSNNVDSFNSLYDYIVKSGLGPGVSFDSATQEFKEGYAAKTWENIVNYLRFRAGKKLAQNAVDKLANAYKVATDKLFMKLKPILDQVKNDPYGDNFILTGAEVDSGKLNTAKPGAAQEGRPTNTTEQKANQAPAKNQSGAEGTDYEFGPDVSKDLVQQPIGYNINLRQLASVYPNDMEWYTKLYGKLLARKVQINVQEFRQDPNVIADNILRDPTIADLKTINPTLTPVNIQWFEANPTHPKTMAYMADAKLRMLSKIVIALRQDLKNVIDTWEANMYNKQMDPRAVQANNTAWNAWSKAFTQLIERITLALRNVDAGSNRYYSY